LVVTVFGWWFSTGLILLLNHLPLRTHRWSMAALSIFCLFTFYQILPTSADTSLAAALIAYGQALVIWGWLEMGYLMGFVTGPSNRTCPPDATGWNRFSLALKTSLYHELLVVVVILAVVARTAGGPNQVTALCCMTLWLMRWSAKLNLFLGVRNFHADWLPKSQRYLASYINQSHINLLLPFSVLLGSAFSVYFFTQAAQGSNGAETAGNFIVALLLALAVIEHLFLVLPLDDSKLWQWALTVASALTPTKAPAKDRGTRFVIETRVTEPRVAEHASR
jgi:putative photosynthetic complex assembly protein 2